MILWINFDKNRDENVFSTIFLLETSQQVEGKEFSTKLKWWTNSGKLFLKYRNVEKMIFLDLLTFFYIRKDFYSSKQKRLIHQIHNQSIHKDCGENKEKRFHMQAVENFRLFEGVMRQDVLFVATIFLFRLP